ncbi:MAG TPA: NAD(P)-dependent oxidoreductase [Tianweitania sediminis]|jgi:uronate dehydrogenase|nr:NAD(P)-dependent oxidoreductase [Tianweitania sediminis]
MNAQSSHLEKVVLTGAAGRLGRLLRPALAAHTGDLISSDRVRIDQQYTGETFTACDLSDLTATERLLAGAGAVVHFGGISNQRAFNELLDGNFVGAHNVFDAAQRAGVRRMVYASSNHAVGFYSADQLLDTQVAYRPDSFYGLSKAFGELLGRFYHDRYGLEVVCLRIGSCIERPTKARHLSTWLSHEDLVRLVLASLTSEGVGFEILYGVSNNARAWWTNPDGPVRYRPQDSADAFIDQVTGADENDGMFQGGQACLREVR